MSYFLEGVPFSQFSEDLLCLYTPPIRAVPTFRRMRQVCRMLLEFGIASTCDLTTPNIARWSHFRAETVKINTVIGELGYIRALCRFAIDEGRLERDPFSSRRLRLRPRPNSRKTHHSLDEISRLLAHLKWASSTWKGHRLYALAATFAFTGLRRNEGLWLRVEDLDLERGYLEVVPRVGNLLKTERSAAPVPIPPQLVEVLRCWIPKAECAWVFPNLARTGPWIGGNPGTKPLDRLKQAGLAAGVHELTWQSLRHTWATQAETSWGLSDGVIQRVLRHTTPLTQKRYRHADVDNLVRSTRQISFGKTEDSSPETFATLTSPPASE